MAINERTIELLLIAAADTNASQQTIRTLFTIQQAIDATRNAANTANPAFKQLKDAIKDAGNSPEIQKLIADLREAQVEANKLTKSLPDVTQKAPRAGTSQLGSSERLFGSVLYNLPGNTFSPAAEIFRVTGGLEMLSQRAKELSGSTGSITTGFARVIGEAAPMVVLFMALAGAMDLLKKSQEAARKPLDDFIASMAKINVSRLDPYQMAPGATGESLDKAREDQGRYVSELSFQWLQLNQILQNKEHLTGVEKALVDLYGGMDGVDKKATEVSANLTIATDNLDKLGDAALKAAAAANDYYSQLEKGVDQQLAYDKLERTGTSKGVEGMLTDQGDELNQRQIESSRLAERLQPLLDRLKPDDHFNASSALIQGDAKGFQDIVSRAVGLSDAEKIYIADLIKTQERIDALSASMEYLTLAVLPAIKAREAEAEGIKRLQKEQDDLTKKREKEADQVNKLGQQIDLMIADRAKQVEREQEDDAIAAQRKAVEADYQKRIEAAKASEAEADYQAKIGDIKDKAQLADQKAAEKYNEDVAKVNDGFMASELDATQKFHEKALKDDSEYGKRRSRLLEDLYDKLTDLAANRDVAGFILAQRQGEKDLRRLDEDHAGKAAEDTAQFAKEREAAKKANDTRLVDLANAYQREKRDRAEQLQERLDQERAAHERRVRQSDQLERELQALREQWQIDDNTRRRNLEAQDFEDRLALERQKQGESLAQLGGYWQSQIDIIRTFGQSAGAQTYNQGLYTTAGAVGNVIQNGPSDFLTWLGSQDIGNYAPAPVGTGQASNTGRTLTDAAVMRSIPRFATGIDDTGNGRMLAMLDPHETVLNDRAAAAWRSGMSGGGTTVNMYYTVGDVATKRMLLDTQRETVQIVANGLRGGTR